MTSMMGDRLVMAVLMVVLLSSWSLMAVTGLQGRQEEEEVVPKGRQPLFILGKYERVVKTAGGEVRMVTGHRWKGDLNPMHVGFIHMEPNTLFIPQYIDANLILFVRHGEVKVAWIHKDRLVERKLKRGDVNVIPAGSAFYLANTGNGESLQVVCSIDTSESLGYKSYQSFFIGGGSCPTSVLAGFNSRTLSSAFNVTSDELGTIMRHKAGGPIIFVGGEPTDQPNNLLASMMRLKQNNKETGDDHDSEEGEEEEEEVGTWTWRKLLSSITGKEVGCHRGKKGKPARSTHPYNLYDREPSFKNEHGWSIAINEHDYQPLKRSDIGVYLVNLTAGSMLAPHLNPTATEYGIILKGSGTIQVVFPNGSEAMNAEVREGDAFWIPRYFPFCQIASRDGPLEFVGFTTSSRRNRQQFLVGRSSVLHRMRGPELAASFGVSEQQLEKVIKAQEESFIIPYSSQREEDEEKEEESLLITTKVAA